MKTSIRSILWFTIAFYSLLYYVLFQVGISNLQIYRIPLHSTYNDIAVPNFCDTPIHCRDSTVETGHSADQSSHQDRKETRDNARKKVGKEASLVGPVRGTDRETRQSNRVTRRSQCQPCARGKFFISTSEVVSRERCRLKHRSHLPRSYPTLYRYGQMGYPGDKNSYLSSNSCRQFLFLFTFRSLRVGIDQLLVDHGFLYSDECNRRNRIIINRRLCSFVNITTSKRSICLWIWTNYS